MAVDLGIERLIGQDQTIRFCYGGEGEIRTPDSLTTMPDFESGVVSITTVFTAICGASLLRCYLECHINPGISSARKPGSAKHSAHVYSSTPDASHCDHLPHSAAWTFGRIVESIQVSSSPSWMSLKSHQSSTCSAVSPAFSIRSGPKVSSSSECASV